MMQSRSSRVPQHASVTFAYVGRRLQFVGLLTGMLACSTSVDQSPTDSAIGSSAIPGDTSPINKRSSALSGNAASRVLRVCADPNNLPFSNNRGAGFENALVEIVARELGARVEYVWWAQRRGFVRSTLRTNSCDVIAGIPTSIELVTPTRPYYRSTYVFVTRQDRALKVATLDDDILRHAKVGVQLVGDDYANSPPAHALGARGIVRNVRGFSVYGDYADTMPTAPIMRAVVAREIDIAIVWGPLAGFYAKRTTTPLRLVPVSPQIDVPFLPFVYDVSMGVRHGDLALRDSLNAVLVRRRIEIDSLLGRFGVPRADRVLSRTPREPAGL